MNMYYKAIAYMKDKTASNIKITHDTRNVDTMALLLWEKKSKPVCSMRVLHAQANPSSAAGLSKKKKSPGLDSADTRRKSPCYKEVVLEYTCMSSFRDIPWKRRNTISDVISQIPAQWCLNPGSSDIQKFFIT